MADKFLAYTKRSDYLVCVDSDGCAMDTMDIKHIRCFSPCTVAEWGLEEWRDAILARWNEINLYTMTRGINRFKGLVKALGEIREKYCEIEELDVLEKWVKETPELSNAALEREITKNDNICLRKALAWSSAVNQFIDRLPEEDKRPFPGVLEALKRAYRDADIAIVSSANLSAVLPSAIWRWQRKMECIITRSWCGMRRRAGRNLSKKGSCVSWMVLTVTDTSRKKGNSF